MGACKDSDISLVPGSIRIVRAGLVHSTRVLIGKLSDQDGCLVSFRGSANLINWLRDFEFWRVKPTQFEDCKGCKVHLGFYRIWKSAHEEVVEALKLVGCTPEITNPDNKLYITGHSLGAAVTHLAVFDLAKSGFEIAKSYSFEAPRVGNKAFSDAFAQRFTARLPLYRVTHDRDPVVHLPVEDMGYAHVPTEVFYDRQGDYKICPEVEDSSCSDQYKNLPDLFALHTGDHCNSPLVPNGDICHPAGCSLRTRDVQVFEPERSGRVITV